eukprot:scaffold848_cov236-Chaetoceros_neogracile.AAC.2
MVKFGRHLQFFLENEEGTECSHYIVPYNELRDDIYANASSNDSESFEIEWKNSLKKASDDFSESTTSCWSSIFEAIQNIPNARGATLESALRFFTPTVGISESRDLLVFLKRIYNTAALNSEALRKLVKKFDKQGPASLSAILLPELYTSNFSIGVQSLDASINILRELLDDLDEFHSDYTTGEHNIGKHTKPRRKMSYDNEETTIGRRANEMIWLRDTIRQIPEQEIKHAVAHRGFHNPKGRSDLRPLENSLAAFEAAWTNGMHLCECDVALTKDEKLVLAHDSDFSRLSLDPASETSNTKVSNLTFKELIALTLKNGVRAPLLLDVLHSANAIGLDAQLIIEIKPGENQASTALARLLGSHPEYVQHVAVIMSFDLWAMHKLRHGLERNLLAEPSPMGSPPRLFGNSMDKQFLETSVDTSPSSPTMPKLMLLTVAQPPIDHNELWVDCNDYGPIDGWLNTDDSCLDGVYVQYEPEMLEQDGAAELKALCKKYTVGVWGVANTDPDDYETMHYLVNECGVSYFNTDMPRNFLKGTKA